MRAGVTDFRVSWKNYLPLVEVAYNKSYHSGIQMALYEALYEESVESPIGWFNIGEVQIISPDLIQRAVDKAKLIQERLLASPESIKALCR